MRISTLIKKRAARSIIIIVLITHQKKKDINMASFAFITNDVLFFMIKRNQNNLILKLIFGQNREMIPRIKGKEESIL